MSDAAKQKHLDLELQRIEKRVEELVRICNQLKEENRSLRQRQEMLVAERAGLLQKNDLVRGRVEAMIERLKSMEHSA
jgi:cell division protein ZapB